MKASLWSDQILIPISDGHFCFFCISRYSWINKDRLFCPFFGREIIKLHVSQKTAEFIFSKEHAQWMNYIFLALFIWARRGLFSIPGPIIKIRCCFGKINHSGAMLFTAARNLHSTVDTTRQRCRKCKSSFLLPRPLIFFIAAAGDWGVAVLRQNGLYVSFPPRNRNIMEGWKMKEAGMLYLKLASFMGFVFIDPSRTTTMLDWAERKQIKKSNEDRRCNTRAWKNYKIIIMQ